MNGVVKAIDRTNNRELVILGFKPATPTYFRPENEHSFFFLGDYNFNSNFYGHLIFLCKIFLCLI